MPLIVGVDQELVDRLKAPLLRALVGNIPAVKGYLPQMSSPADAITFVLNIIVFHAFSVQGREYFIHTGFEPEQEV